MASSSNTDSRVSSIGNSNKRRRTSLDVGQRDERIVLPLANDFVKLRNENLDLENTLATRDAQIRQLTTDNARLVAEKESLEGQIARANKCYRDIYNDANLEVANCSRLRFEITQLKKELLTSASHNEAVNMKLLCAEVSAANDKPTTEKLQEELDHSEMLLEQARHAKFVLTHELAEQTLKATQELAKQTRAHHKETQGTIDILHVEIDTLRETVRRTTNDLRRVESECDHRLVKFNRCKGLLEQAELARTRCDELFVKADEHVARLEKELAEERKKVPAISHEDAVTPGHPISVTESHTQ